MQQLLSVTVCAAVHTWHSAIYTVFAFGHYDLYLFYVIGKQRNVNSVNALSLHLSHVGNTMLARPFFSLPPLQLKHWSGLSGWTVWLMSDCCPHTVLRRSTVTHSRLKCPPCTTWRGCGWPSVYHLGLIQCNTHFAQPVIQIGMGLDSTLNSNPILNSLLNLIRFTFHHLQWWKAKITTNQRHLITSLLAEHDSF